MPPSPLLDVDRGRAALRTMWQIRRFEELRAANGSANNVTVVKEALASLGLCRREVRPPSRPLPDPGSVDAVAATGNRLRTSTCRPSPGAPVTRTVVAVPPACLATLVRASWTIR